MSPSATETASEREERLAEEFQAKQISDKIDKDIEKERENNRKSVRAIKVLLLGAPFLRKFGDFSSNSRPFVLGQSESGE